MLKKRSIRCYQRMMAQKSDGMTCQLPVTLFLHDEDTLPEGIRIDIHHSTALNLCVPYLAAPDRCGRYGPLELDGSLFPEIPMDTPAVRALKMRTFRLQLPPLIATQYRLAALLKVHGFDCIPAIESGAVIRNLMARYDRRRMLAAPEWTTGRLVEQTV